MAFLVCQTFFNLFFKVHNLYREILEILGQIREYQHEGNGPAGGDFGLEFRHALAGLQLGGNIGDIPLFQAFFRDDIPTEGHLGYRLDLIAFEQASHDLDVMVGDVGGVFHLSGDDE